MRNRNVDNIVSLFTDPSFIATYWQRQPRVWQLTNDIFLKTANLGGFQKLIKRHWELFPEGVSFYYKGRQIDYEAFKNTQEITPEFWREVLKQHPVVIQQLYLSNAFFCQLSTLMQYYFGAFTPVSAYVSYGNTKGAKKHRDRGHVFVFQFKGTCKWILHAKNKRTKLMEVVMEPGMMMYIPQGVYHRVIRMSEFNTHVSVGLRYYNPRHEMQCMLAHQVFQPALLPEHRNLNENQQAALLANYSDEPLKRDN